MPLNSLSLISFVSALALAQPQPVPCPAASELDQAELESLTETIRAEIEALRGERFPRAVRVSVADRESFLAYAKKRMDKMTTPEEFAAQEMSAKLLGLIPAEMDYLATLFDLLEEQVGGFYDPETESFFLMAGFGGDLARVILAHELTHALDDQLYDIDGTLERRADNADATFAYHAVVEGSGTAVMNKWTISKLAELDQGEVRKAGNMGQEALSKAPPFLWKPLIGSYLKGASFLARTKSVLKGQMTMPELEDFRRAFQDPPRSSEQILHPEKYWDSERKDEPVPVGFEAGAWSDDVTVLHEDTLGEMGMALLTQDLGDRAGLVNPLATMKMKYTHAPSEGWGGDRYQLLQVGQGRVLVTKSVWDSETDAREFRGSLVASRQHFESATGLLAERLELSGSGLLIDPSVSGEQVHFALWVGCEPVAVEGLLAQLR